MSMTKKDYELVAEAFLEGFSYDCDTTEAEDALAYVAQRLADKLNKQNKDFKRDLFLKQCGVDNE